MRKQKFIINLGGFDSTSWSIKIIFSFSELLLRRRMNFISSRKARNFRTTRQRNYSKQTEMTRKFCAWELRKLNQWIFESISDEIRDFMSWLGKLLRFFRFRSRLTVKNWKIPILLPNHSFKYPTSRSCATCWLQFQIVFECRSTLLDGLLWGLSAKAMWRL